MRASNTSNRAIRAPSGRVEPPAHPDPPAKREGWGARFGFCEPGESNRANRGEPGTKSESNLWEPGASRLSAPNDWP
jgi:hypothetical protein